MSFRTLHDQTAIAQLVGRMVRTPLGIRVPGDETLNSTHLFLPLFDPAQLERVKAYLESDIGESSAEVDLGTESQELVVRSGGEELFERMKTLPTVVVPPGRPIPDIRRLLRFARLLEQDGLATKTTVASVEGLIALMADQLAAGDVAEQAAARGQFTLHSLTVESGLVVAVEDQEEAVSREDIQAAFRAHGLLVAEELSLAWLRYRYDAVGSKQAKLEFLAITSNAGLLQRLQVKARALLSALEAEYRARIIALPPARVDLYASLQRSGRIAQSAIMAPYARVIFPMPDVAVQVPSHLYVRTGSADECRMELNTWEAETLVEERRRPGFRAFLRNLPNKRWALSYAYDYNGLKPGFPDFLIFRDNPEGDLTVDIMEPHLDSGDSVAKAHGLARFALENPGTFGRVEMLRKSTPTGPLRRLPLGNSETAGVILDSVLTSADLNSAFANRGYVADW
jgi:type III restriction enzyme